MRVTLRLQDALSHQRQRALLTFSPPSRRAWGQPFVAQPLPRPLLVWQPLAWELLLQPLVGLPASLQPQPLVRVAEDLRQLSLWQASQRPLGLTPSGCSWQQCAEPPLPSDALRDEPDAPPLPSWPPRASAELPFGSFQPQPSSLPSVPQPQQRGPSLPQLLPLPSAFALPPRELPPPWRA